MILIVCRRDCVDLQLTQIVPMYDEELGEDGPAIVKAKICDPYVILLRADGSVVVYKLDKSLELAKVDGRSIEVCFPQSMPWENC